MSKKHITVEKSSQKIMRSLHAVNCRVCEMINICDRSRILCPYCGSFYDPNMKTESDYINRKRSSNSTVEKIDTELIEEDTSSSRGFKSLIKNFLNISKKSSSNQSLTRPSFQKANTTANLDCGLGTNVEKLHQFFSLANKDPNFFKELKTKLKLDCDDFKNLINKATEESNFKDVVDFYCWNFSKSSNLTSLLVIEKPIKSKQSPYMATSSIFNFTINWKYMKEIYTFLQKMVQCKKNLLMFTSFIF